MLRGIGARGVVVVLHGGDKLAFEVVGHDNLGIDGRAVVGELAVCLLGLGGALFLDEVDVAAGRGVGAVRARQVGEGVGDVGERADVVGLLAVGVELGVTLGVVGIPRAGEARDVACDHVARDCVALGVVLRLSELVVVGLVSIEGLALNDLMLGQGKALGVGTGSARDRA